MGLAALMVGSVGNATADVVNATASADVVAPLLLTETTSMYFGDVAGGTAIGTVVLDTANGRTVGGDASALVSAAGVSAVFGITGAAGQTFSLAFGAGNLSNGTPADDMAVDTFTQTLAATANALPGVGTFSVGATLHLGANQPAGFYTTAGGGTAVPYTVTAQYE